jgi:hypothetical protein
VAKLEAIEAKLIESPESLPATFRLLEKLIGAAAALAGNAERGTGNGEFEWWRRMFEQNCRDHREDLEACFPWLKLCGRIDQRLTGTVCCNSRFKNCGRR